MKCPACSHENVDGTTFCEMCGEDLQGASGASSAAGSTPVAGSGAEIKCPACENMNPAENVVCEICGTELRAPDDSDAAIAASASTPAADTPASNIPAPTATIDTVSTPVPPAAPALDLTDVAAPATTPFDAALSDVAASSAPPAAPSTPDPISAPVAVPAPIPATTPAPDAASTPAVAGAPLSPGKVKLVVEQGMTIGKQFVLSDAEVQVGREDEDEGIYPDIDLADQDEGYVHRKHATLKFENDQLTVTHLGGANRTRINNKPIPDNTPQVANLGDKIAFGKVVLRLTAV